MVTGSPGWHQSHDIWSGDWHRQLYCKKNNNKWKKWWRERWRGYLDQGAFVKRGLLCRNRPLHCVVFVHAADSCVCGPDGSRGERTFSVSNCEDTCSDVLIGTNILFFFCTHLMAFVIILLAIILFFFLLLSKGSEINKELVLPLISFFLNTLKTSLHYS